ncbi:MAG: ATP-binding cassette domain-containing protein [Gammaproteobacteria bacterium]|nr:ATP-binding cassette domain-containing protein [Gammaproteobacteria bacterium]MCP5137984.1 ATP-binding cassette domain-containing protein [Gammaproteobacteria bacterium]
MLRFSDLAIRRGPRLLFEQVDFQVHAGWKIGLTGGNGTGKSSLFALIRDHLHPDAGDFHMPADWRIAHVAQETPATDRPAIDYAMDGDTELRQVEADLVRAEAAHDGHAQAELHAHLAHIGGYEARSRAARLLHGLGFGIGTENRPVETFSGGWRMRLNLAQALMARSDLLLLDEPTNHLDLDAVIWLEDWLRAYPGTLILISHDRDFLDRVVDHVAHIEQQRITLYTGNYTAFEAMRAERLANQQSAFERQQREIAHMHSFVERFRAKASKAKQAQSRLKALARMEEIAPAHVDSPFDFEFRVPKVLPDPLLRIDEAAVGYDGKAIVADINMTLLPGERIGLLGPNGAGKSTLIKLLAGVLEPLHGRRDTAKDLNIGYFAQHQLEQLDPAASPLLHLQRLDKRATDQELRNFLGGFDFRGDRVDEAIEPFSGGEKARLVLALLVWQRPNLLLLDEPTNHLDLEMRHALNIALQGFDGAVVLVSHDRHLLRTVCDRLVLVEGGRVSEFDQDLDAYAAWLAERRRAEEAPRARPVGSGGGDNDAQARKQRKRDEAERRRLSQPLRNRASTLEKKVDRLSADKQRLETELADPAIYEASAKIRLKERLATQTRILAELQTVEEEWMEVLAELEAFDH